MDPPHMDDLNLSDSDSEILFDTPAPHKMKNKAQDDDQNTGEGVAASKTRTKQSHYSAEESREAALRKELETVRNVNKVIEGVVESLEKAKNNMDTVSRTVHNASTLLQTWTRILSQTEHNQRLILNPQWQGSSQDQIDIQNEEIQRQHAAERREAEERARQAAAARKAEEERRRAEAVSKPSTRGRGRGTVKSRAGSTSGGYVGVGGQAGRGVSRGASTSSTRSSGIGRGLRGRGRGLG
ncbi:hypothetical protein GQ43DRAFT_427072 [Delitschia confertaspora ATCC 74209]|uniref:DASH complex subunit DUO1 n=1 Tax=Delitschia confertaspora ATCC 74209 TaxID=1513339 RepID=A0A9P4MKQ1_9PLEO|nr:hypothetical protein GQ43DRAFT_427072 [Delitschia confertaspora ATCC 74209]